MFPIMTKPKEDKSIKGLVFFLYLLLTFPVLALAADKTPPTGSITINSYATYTSSASVTLNLSASDKGSGMKKGKSRFSNDNSNWSSTENYKTSKSWTLSSGDGTKTVYAKFCDAKGNWMRSPVSDTIILDTSKPSTDTTIPNISKVVPEDKSFVYQGKSQSLSITTDDTDSYQNYYQFSIDGSIKQSWSTNSSYSWDTSSSSLKKYTLKFEAKDDGGSSSKESKVFLIKEPVSPPDD